MAADAISKCADYYADGLHIEGQTVHYQGIGQYVVVRFTKEHTFYKYVNGESIKYKVKPTLGMTQKNNPKI